MKKLTNEQQELTEKLFQINHAYLLLDGVDSLTLPNIVHELVKKLKYTVKEEHGKLLEQVKDES